MKNESAKGAQISHNLMNDLLEITGRIQDFHRKHNLRVMDAELVLNFKNMTDLTYASKEIRSVIIPHLVASIGMDSLYIQGVKIQLKNKVI